MSDMSDDLREHWCQANDGLLVVYWDKIKPNLFGDKAVYLNIFVSETLWKSFHE